MSKQVLRYGILVLGIITGVIHAVILNLLVVDWLMLLNGLGFFALTLAVFFNPPFLAAYRKWIFYLFMAYTLVTFIGFFVLTTPPYGPLAIIAKIDEILLIVALWFYKDQ